MTEAHRQLPFRVRMDWGLDGARAIGEDAATTVVVDVLSFTTAVTVAVDDGIVVLPYRWSDDGAAAHAARHAAVLAVRRSAAGPGDLTLSPASIRAAAGVDRLVLPSPNGSTIAAHLLDHGAEVLAGALRNASAVADWVTTRHGVDGGTVAVVAAGERWPGDTLRPAVEDLWGAGAVVAALLRAGWTSASPEARAAAAAFTEARADLPARLRTCAGGAELAATGHGADVDIAAELDHSPSVPVLDAGGFRDARATAGT
ncbi:2-phosphosulfolactate phosphatase [Actinotalea ferrariae CF5-4]|uniref:Probable 2-phosphosulfolactate phosphatase n=1 Tax=Actinotalea ferrariae CF5-4 TaxID=948458 RepID=A0A021VTM2_9CELL|nr:2-phosphosulfolactate phosphatase [Actinotalea ferrariae]EYR64554.1 2-phosphosulfolactate phosphatase [Actinotalea ferrariae CF5-4]